MLCTMYRFDRRCHPIISLIEMSSHNQSNCSCHSIISLIVDVTIISLIVDVNIISLIVDVTPYSV